MRPARRSALVLSVALGSVLVGVAALRSEGYGALRDLRPGARTPGTGWSAEAALEAAWPDPAEALGGVPTGAASAAAGAPEALGAGAGRGLLPDHRIVTFYGNPRSARMGILGALPPHVMLARLREQAEAYERADPSTPVLPALHLVTVVAQKDPGSSGLYRARMPASLVEEVAGWAAPDSMLLFLDIQPGRSPAVSEVRAYLDFLRRPHVHLALDPEFAMGPGQVPGTVIGSIDAEQVNQVIALLAELVEEHGLPPKILVIHRFTERMLVGHDRIRLDPRVQVVITMDGFGRPALKRDSYRAVVARQPVQFAGFKLFYQQDVPLMSADDVLALSPVPVFIVYQ